MSPLSLDLYRFISTDWQSVIVSSCYIDRCRLIPGKTWERAGKRKWRPERWLTTSSTWIFLLINPDNLLPNRPLRYMTNLIQRRAMELGLQTWRIRYCNNFSLYDHHRFCVQPFFTWWFCRLTMIAWDTWTGGLAKRSPHDPYVFFCMQPCFIEILVC